MPGWERWESIIRLMRWEETVNARRQTHMIYTPKRGIPVGEPIQRGDGTYVLRIKRANRNEFEEITLDYLMMAIVSCAQLGSRACSGDAEI